MTQACNFCGSCGMPLEKNELIGGSRPDFSFCIHCANPDGSLKPYEDVLAGFAGFLVDSQGLDEFAARSIAKESMHKLPAWKKNEPQIHTFTKFINCPHKKAFDYITNPKNLLEYCAFVSKGWQEGDYWIFETPQGPLKHRFTVNETYGIFDAEITMPSGNPFFSHIRIIPSDKGCILCEVFQKPDEVPQAMYEEWKQVEEQNLERLKAILEQK